MRKRTACPRTPVKLPQLPPWVQAGARRVRFDLCFAETPHLQPADHTRCVAPVEAYLSLAHRDLRRVADGDPAPAPDLERDPILRDYLRRMRSRSPER